jgi:hypothetical protein
MTLEQEIAAATQRTRVDLANEAVRFHDLDQAGRQAVLTVVETLAPHIGDLRDALLRLAREIDELKAAKAED